MNFYHACLTDDCIPFWINNGIDREHGGYYTCLDEKGVLYDTNKSVWFQGRMLWVFSKLYNEIEKRDEWLSAAATGYTFLKEYCFGKDGRMYFIVTEDGLPVQQRRYYYSETFAVIGLAEYAKATGSNDALEMAKRIFDAILDMYINPPPGSLKYNPETVKIKSMAVPMILISTVQCLRSVDIVNASKYTELINGFMKEIFDDFMKPEIKALLEHVGLQGKRL